MTTVIVYDENILESFMAAACIMSAKTDKDQLTAVERKSVMKAEADRYVWIGVVPTYKTFPSNTMQSIRARLHDCIANATKDQQVARPVEGVNYLYGTEQTTATSEFAKFGARSLTERALMYFNHAPVHFSGVVDMVNSFYNPLTCLEDLYMSVLNAKEALHCLATGEVYKYIPYGPEAAERGKEIFDVLKENEKNASANRCIHSDFQVKDRAGKLRVQSVFTYFEHHDWWFIQRSLVWNRVFFRNVSVNVTGAVVITNTNIIRDLMIYSPTVVASQSSTDVG